MRSKLLLAYLCALPTTFAASLQKPFVNEPPDRQVPLAQQNDENSNTQFDIPHALGDVLDALSKMQGTYYNLLAGTWPDAIDWTAAVMGTHVSATLSSLISGWPRSVRSPVGEVCSDFMGYDNTVNRYFLQTSMFYFAENAFGLRNQAYDDMLWVVLGWLEHVKFAEMYATQFWQRSMIEPEWHGMQMAPLAAHRARIFWELAKEGWDEELCGGGMVWNPQLEPYKNAITNELFMAASVAMYLYWPGDNNTAPFRIAGVLPKEHNCLHLEMAIRSYEWLMEANMKNDAGLFHDGYHITGWKRHKDGTIDPGTKKCDSLDEMVYTYNQGVILTASRGLWLATGENGYLDDGHRIVEDVIKATGWPGRDRRWKGLGRSGVLEEFCDRKGQCSQDGQTFKGIFFHHLTEFCRPLWPQEEDLFVSLESNSGLDASAYEYHLSRCRGYSEWIEHNAQAALKTRNKDGLFGMWWGVSAHSSIEESMLAEGPQELPKGVVDHRNPWCESEEDDVDHDDPNERGRGRTVESQSGGLAVLRARWQWQSVFGKDGLSLGQQPAQRSAKSRSR